MLEKIINFFTSLRLTVVCLTFALGLVFIGTLAQVKWGLWVVQEKYFNSWFVFWEPAGSSLTIPVYPGGFLLGTLLLINLIAAHIKRFEISKKKIGIFTIHAGLILLLVGQLLTQLFQVESYMAIEEGSAKNYSESGRMSELAIIDVTDTNSDFVVAIPEQVLANREEISAADLPFKIKVQSFYANSEPRLVPSAGNGKGTHQLDFAQTNIATAMDDRNIPAATVEIVGENGSQGVFKVSNWLSETRLAEKVWENWSTRLDPDFANRPGFTYNGRQYELALRPVRYYKPFTIQLLDFTHERYKGTEIPKDFSSRIRLVRPETEENREVLIYMNNPLRYWGETYYQGGFEPGDTVSILQVVRNPSWLTPYIACTLVGGGLLIQFLSHLISFGKKRSR